MKFKNIYIGVAFMALFSSCSDEMDYHEYVSYDKEYVLTDFARAGALVTNIYSYLDYDMPGTGALCSACDESEYAWSWAYVRNYYNGAWSATNTTSFFNYYSAIRAANNYLEIYDEADFSEHQEDKDYVAQMNRFNRYQYEVRFLRAYYYFILVRAYGDVPFTTKVMTDKEANAMERTSASTVIDFIVNECDQIADKLPIRYTDLKDDAANGDSPETGRVPRGAVLALKARTLLYAASPLLNSTNDKELWKKSAQASKDVIDFCAENDITMGKYSALWGTDNWKAGEVIFARRIGDSNSWETTNFPVGMENGNSGNCPTQTLVDAYEMKTTGLAWDEANSGYDAKFPYANRDPRLGMTVAVNGESWPSTNPNKLETYVGGRNGLPISGATPTGYYLKKYLDTSIDISATNSTGGKRHNWVTFRLGEFYLNYAESVFNYLGSADGKDATFTLSAREAVNRVRTGHSDVNMPEFPEGMSNDAFKKKYERERMVELAFEGHRFWDIRRWKEGDVLKSICQMQITKSGDSFNYKRVTVSRQWDDKMYLFPIPDVERRKNPNLSQNAGW